MALASSVQLTPQAPGVISNATVAGAYMFFLADGTAGTIANGLFKKDSAGVVTPLLPNGSVSNAMHADMVQSTIKGRAAGAGTGPPADLTEAQVVAILATTFPLGNGAWTPYTPTWTQGVAITKTVGSARYMQIGKTVIVNIYLVATGSGTASSTILVGLPIPANSGALDSAIGSVFAYDSSAPLLAAGVATMAGTSPAVAALWTNGAGSAMGNAGSGFAVQIAVGDQVRLAIVYEGA